MILVGSQRAGAGQLARHLLNDRDNDHVTLQELRGFMSDNLSDALNEAHAVSLGTRCKQFMFSLSFNPPKDANASIEDLYAAMERAEEKLGLKDQPRAVVVHEKNGRRHMHVVWSRIDAQSMTAINLPHFKTKLAALSKELYLDHGWNLPDGHKENGWKNPMNFTLAEWQQAQRVGLDPREIKQVFRDAWQQSDGLKSFRAALEEHGYYLAKGDRRGFVAVDVNGEVFSVARMTGVKTKDVEARLGRPDILPSVDTVKADLRDRLTGKLCDRIDESRREQAEEMKPLVRDYRRTVLAQRTERAELALQYKQQRMAHTKERAMRYGRVVKWVREFLGQSRPSEQTNDTAKLSKPNDAVPQIPRAVPGVWERFKNAIPFIRNQNANESYEEYLQYRRECETMIEAQMQERRDALQRILDLRAEQRAARIRVAGQIAFLLDLEQDKSREFTSPPRNRSRGPSFH